MRVKVVLACSECGGRNYVSSKDKLKHPERVERKKHCPRCNAHTTHREAR
jgi:large subunit ribosomal protein L33